MEFTVDIKTLLTVVVPLLGVASAWGHLVSRSKHTNETVAKHDIKIEAIEKDKASNERVKAVEQKADDLKRDKADAADVKTVETKIDAIANELHALTLAMRDRIDAARDKVSAETGKSVDTIWEKLDQLAESLNAMTKESFRTRGSMETLSSNVANLITALGDKTTVAILAAPREEEKQCPS